MQDWRINEIARANGQIFTPAQTGRILRELIWGSISDGAAFGTGIRSNVIGALNNALIVEKQEREAIAAYRLQQDNKERQTLSRVPEEIRDNLRQLRDDTVTKTGAERLHALEGLERLGRQNQSFHVGFYLPRPEALENWPTQIGMIRSLAHLEILSEDVNRPGNKSPSDWAALAQRGRTLLSDKPDALEGELALGTLRHNIMASFAQSVARGITAPAGSAGRQHAFALMKEFGFGEHVSRVQAAGQNGTGTRSFIAQLNDRFGAVRSWEPVNNGIQDKRQRLNLA